MDEYITTFIEDVKFNCNLSDAKYWGYFSICGLLMRMRELYRSEHGLMPWSEIKTESILEWIEKKERLWAEIEKNEFKNLRLKDKIFEPFEVFEINNHLKASGLVYGAGYGLYMKPTFFIGRLHSYSEINDYSIYVVKDELARDIFTSTGMLQGRCIFLRLSPMKSHLWEKFIERGSGKNPLLEKLFSQYESNSGYSDKDMESIFDEISLKLSSVILDHEIAEAIEDIPQWTEIILNLSDRESEYRLRALKDIIADTSEYGPLKRVIVSRDTHGIALYTSMIENHRDPFYKKLKKEILFHTENNNWNALDVMREKIYKSARALKNRILNSFLNGNLRKEIKDIFSDPITI